MPYYCKCLFFAILFLASTNLYSQKNGASIGDSIPFHQLFEDSQIQGELGNFKEQSQILDSLGKNLFKHPSQSFQLKVFIAIIENSLRTKSPDSTLVLFDKAQSISQGLRENHPLRLKLETRQTAFHLKQGFISSDSALASYSHLLPSVKMARKYALETEVLGRIALVYRTKKELGKALNFNQQEIVAAEKSKDKIEIAKSRISELDILYELIPRPVQVEDIRPLIVKGEELLSYMKSKNIDGIRPYAQLYLSKFYVHAENFEKALNVLEEISDSSQMNIYFSKYEQLCEIAKSQNDLLAYRKYVLIFKPIAYKTTREFVLLNVHNYLLDYFMKVEKRDSAAFYADLLEGNLKRVDTSQYLSYLSWTYSLLSDFYAGENFKKALLYQKKRNAIDKEIIQTQKQALTKIIDYKEETENLLQENSKLNQGFSFIKNNLIALSFLVIGLLVVLVFGIKKYRKSKEDLQSVTAEKKKIEKVVEQDFILLNSKTKVYLKTIYFIKSEGNYIDFHLKEKSITDRNKLGLVLENLPPNFVQCHRSYIVNKNFIQSFSSTTIHLSNGKELPLSRTYKSALD